MARLIFGTPRGEQPIELRAFNGLGRHPSNTIQLMDKIASKEHCVVEQRGAEFILRDLGSLNGTYVNGRRVAGEQLLRHGDEIELGMTRARFDDGVSPRTYPKLAVSPEIIPQPVASAKLAVGTAQPVTTGPPGNPTPSPTPGNIDPLITPSPVAVAPQTPRRPPEPARPPVRPAEPARPAPANAAGRAAEPLRPAPAPPVSVEAAARGFLPFEAVVKDQSQLRSDYEQMRMMVELTRAIGVEHDVKKLLDKILV